MRDCWTRLRFVLLVVLGALIGMLASRLLFPMVFERGGLVALIVVLLLIGVALLVQAIRRREARV